jgi:hypothetical protein
MFKIDNFEDELFESMSTQLKKNQLESKGGFNRLVKATDLLNNAAEIFEKVGMISESDDIVAIINSISKVNKK